MSSVAPAHPAPVTPVAVPPSATPVAPTAVTAVLLTALGVASAWAVLAVAGAAGVAAAGPDATAPGSLLRTYGAALPAVLVVLAAWRALPRRDPAAAVLSAAGTLLAATGLASLHGTAYGFDGLWSDAGFRTQAVTRFADSPALADYAYRGLTAYYPPLWPWLQGRVAAALDVPAWTVMKPAQLLACAALPLLSWLLWRRLLPDLRAAWVAAAVALATVLAHKPDEWLVLCLLLPWWLEVCRGAARRDVPARGWLAHGLVLGLLLLCHTYFFLPLALATVLGVVVDLVRRRPVRPAPGRAVAIGLVGLLVAAPTWWHLAVARVSGLASDDLQRRWSPHGFDGPALPLPHDARGVLELVGTVWLVLALRRSRLAAGLALALVASYVVQVGGQLVQPLGVAVLPEKSEELTEAVLTASGVLGVAAVLRRVRAGATQPRRSVAVLAGLATALVGTGLAAASLERGVLEHASPALTMRYPDGSFPAGGPVPHGPTWHPWGVAPGAGPASVAEVRHAWRGLSGVGLGPDHTVVSARADVAAVTPVHLFLPWKSIYSHPHGRFEDRLAVLRALEACATPSCAHRELRGNDLEPVDGLVLNRDGRGYYLSVTEDDFPEAWVRERISLDPRLFAEPLFDVVDLPGTAVVRVRP